MNKLTGLISGAALTASMGVASAEEVPEILGGADFQKMVESEMASVTGESRRIRIRNVNNNTNVNQQQQAQCLLLCAGGSISVVAPPLPTPTI
jgi:hypothetical protein